MLAQNPLDLINKGHSVIIYDTCYFGTDHIEDHKNLKLVKGDIETKLNLTNLLRIVM